MKIILPFIVCLPLFLGACVKTSVETVKKKNNVLTQLGDISLAKGDPVMAERFYRKALAEQPKDIPIMKKLASTLASQGKIEQAIESYQQVIEINPKENEALRRQANLYLRSGAYSQSIKRYHQAINAKPNDAKSYNNLGYLLGLANHHEVAMRCYINSNNASQSVSRQNNLAISYALLGESNEALDILYSANPTNPTYAQIIESNIQAIENYQMSVSELSNDDVTKRAALLSELKTQLNPQAVVLALSKLSLDEAVEACGSYDDAFSLELNNVMA